MSEPDSAFLKLQITREGLALWLRARPSRASRWTDWRAIGGRYYLSGGSVALADASDAELDGTLREANARLAAFTRNDDILRHLLAGRAEAPELSLCAFDRRGETFVAGSLAYSESLGDLIVFLTMARSAADHLSPTGRGLAIVHNYLWGDADEQTTTAALRMMPSGESHLLPEADRPSVAPAFQPIADALTEGRLPSEFAVRDEADLLR